MSDIFTLVEGYKKFYERRGGKKPVKETLTSVSAPASSTTPSKEKEETK